MTFLKTVYNKDKKMFVILFAFIVFSLITTISGKEIPPFFVWKMFSYPEDLKPENEFYILEYNNKPYNYPYVWDHHRRIMFVYSIPFYFECLKNNGYEETQIKILNFLKLHNKHFHINQDNIIFRKKNTSEYTKWLKRYTENITGEKADTIAVYKITVDYLNGKQRFLKKELVLSDK